MGQALGVCIRLSDEHQAIQKMHVRRGCRKTAPFFVVFQWAVVILERLCPTSVGMSSVRQGQRRHSLAAFPWLPRSYDYWAQRAVRMTNALKQYPLGYLKTLVRQPLLCVIAAYPLARSEELRVPCPCICVTQWHPAAPGISLGRDFGPLDPFGQRRVALHAGQTVTQWQNGWR